MLRRRLSSSYASSSLSTLSLAGSNYKRERRREGGKKDKGRKEERVRKKERRRGNKREKMRKRSKREEKLVKKDYFKRYKIKNVKEIERN